MQPGIKKHRMINLSGITLGLVMLASLCAETSDVVAAQGSTNPVTRKPVLVELFTSEGCSSCPPADVLLQRLEAEQPVPAAQIIPLEEHVDYWNRDGWFDPYSSPEWTQRQQTYAALVSKDPYTPELVVDGQTQLVGNSPQDAVLAIEDASRSAKTEITISAGSADVKDAHFNVSVGKLAGNTGGDAAEVWLAVTEDGLHSSVRQGENAGHELTHTATLRYLHKIGVANANAAQNSFTGDPVVKLNSRWDVENLNVAVFVQERRSRRIIGAASVKVKG
jgi:hypothetical protein